MNVEALIIAYALIARLLVTAGVLAVFWRWCSRDVFNPLADELVTHARLLGWVVAAALLWPIVLPAIAAVLVHERR